MFSNCPSNVVAIADKGTTSTLVTWSHPTATDNSGIIPNVTHYGKQPGDLFPAGEHNIQYWASDKTGNVGECKFKVFVLGNLGLSVVEIIFGLFLFEQKNFWLEYRYIFFPVKVYGALKNQFLKVYSKWFPWQPATPF